MITIRTLINRRKLNKHVAANYAVMAPYRAKRKAAILGQLRKPVKL